jgi:hypothetical protein
MEEDRGEARARTERALADLRAAARDVDHARQVLTDAELAQAAARQMARVTQVVADAACAAMEAAIAVETSARQAAETALATSQQADTEAVQARARLEEAIAVERSSQGRYREAEEQALERPGADLGVVAPDLSEA